MNTKISYHRLSPRACEELREVIEDKSKRISRRTMIITKDMVSPEVWAEMKDLEITQSIRDEIAWSKQFHKKSKTGRKNK